MPTTAPAIQITEYGGPEVMKLVDLSVGEPGPGELRIRHQACGLNFIDVYQRTGLYNNPLPLTLGMEGAGDASDDDEDAEDEETDDLESLAGVGADEE